MELCEATSVPRSLKLFNGLFWYKFITERVQEKERTSPESLFKATKWTIVMI